MKKIILILIIIKFIKVNSQTGEVFYKVQSIKTDKLDNPTVINLNKELNLLSYKLSYSNNTSLFKKQPSIPKNKMFSDLAQITLGARNLIYQNLKAREVIVPKYIGKDYYLVTKNKPMNNWQLTGKTKKIQNYTCYKAVRKELNKRLSTDKNKIYRFYEAWYTPEIPIGYGPLGNGGLPGLILQLDKVNLARFTATKIILNKKQVKIKKIKKGKRISTKESVRLYRETRKVTLD